jgi:F0F1-type ATP synthase assembly protein I
MFAEAMRELLPYTNLPYQLAVTILVFFGIGYGLDNWLETYPTYTVILSIAGVALGLYSFVRTAIDLSTKKSTRLPKDDNH